MFELNPYLKYLQREEAEALITLFKAIDAGLYDKSQCINISLAGFKQPVQIRAIRADMQSFVNTFIDPYLQKKSYLDGCQFVIDAGSNIGLTAVLFAHWWPECRIVGLEPDQENFELAIKNTAAYPNITILNKGIWPESAHLKIEAGQEDGFVVRQLLPGEKTTSDKNLCEAISIGDILTQFKMKHIDFLKMNVEGSEKEVFSKNTESWLPYTKSMLIELHDGKNAGCSQTVFSSIAPHAFAVAETAPYGILFVKEKIYRDWYAKWYREEIYLPNIDKSRFPQFYLDNEK